MQRFGVLADLHLMASALKGLELCFALEFFSVALFDRHNHTLEVV